MPLNLVFINGRFVPENKATVSIFDFGYLYGDGVFETMRAYNGFIFKLDAHLTRLSHSANQIRIPIPYGLGSIKNLCYQILKKNHLKNASLRITLSRGVGKTRFNPLSCKKPTFSILANPFTGYPKSFYHQGIKTNLLREYFFPPEKQTPKIKSCNYQPNVLAKIKVSRKNLQETLFFNQKGHMVEGITSNLFIVKNKKLLTPSLATGCLNGITRNTVIKIARTTLKLRVKETHFSSKEIFSSHECFLTNSLMEIIPVVQVEEKVIRNGKPGKITLDLLELYGKLVQNQSKKYRNL
jgi:branched-chain amino acid aminotransferase